MAYIYGATNYCTSADGTANRIYQVRLGYELQSQDLINNTSVIKLQLQARSTNSQYKPYGYSQTSHIDGIDFSSKTFDFRSTNTWQTFATTGNITVNHNPDGSYNVEKSGYFTANVSGARPKRGDATVQVSLPTMPRASQITVNDANIGSATNIVINKASDIFTTTLWYKTDSDNDWIKIVDKTSNQVYGWTVPTSFYAKIPNNKTIVCYFKADTYSDDTLIGTKTATATFTATGNPVINSSSATDVNSTTTALTGNSANMVKYASNVQVSVSVSGQNSASVSSVTINGSNVSLSGTNPKTGNITFNGATTNSFEIKVTDSRGYQTTTTHTMTMVNYVPLTINATIKRNQPTDEKVNINASGNYFNASFGSQSNTLSVQYRYKESTSSSWGNWTNLSVTTSGNTYSGSTQLTGFEYDKSYNFEVKAYDKIQEKNVNGITVTKGTPVFWWDNDEFNTNVNTKINAALQMQDNINFLNGHDKSIYWKEGGYGDKFAISPFFYGADDDNKLRIMGAVGGAEEDPNMYDLLTISGKNGNAWLKGGLTIDGNLRTNRSYLYTLNAGADFSGRHYTLVNIPADHAGENAISVNIRGIIGNWVYDKGIIDLQISNRGGLRVYGTFYGNLNTFAEQRIVIFEESDGSHTVYLYCVGVYEGPSTLQITWGGVDYALPTIYTDNRFTYSPSGNNVWESWLHTVVCLQTITGSGIVNHSSGGTLNSSNYARFGNVVTLALEITTTSSISAGSNAFTGTISDVTLRPKISANGTSYNGSSGLLGYIDSNGNITIRDIASTLSSDKTFNIIFTYVI